MSRSGSSGSRGDFKEIRLPNTLPVNALIYFCGRDPRKAKSVRRYYDDASDARSTRSSNSSMWSWSSGGGQTYLVESTSPYWYWDEQTEYSSSSRSRKQKSPRSGRNSRTSQQHSQPTGTWARHATVEDDDDDDSSDDGSVAYGDQGPGPYQPGMMPGMPQPGPPPGAFQPVYGMPAMPQQYPQHGGTTYVPAPNGVPMPPPRQNIPMPRPPVGMPRPPSGGGFVTDRNGIQVFTA